MDLPFLPSMDLNLCRLTLQGNPFSALGSSFLLVPERDQGVGHTWAPKALVCFCPLAVTQANLCKAQKGPGCRKSLGAFIPSKGRLVKVSWGWTA